MVMEDKKNIKKVIIVLVILSTLYSAIGRISTSNPYEIALDFLVPALFFYILIQEIRSK